jgi:quercetin dioxygenase-like cupin family protein
MRWIISLALVTVIGCAPGGVRVTTDEARWRVDELRTRYPLDGTTNIRVDELERTAALSVHLVQVRGGETPHRHQSHDLVVTVLDGAGVLTIAGERRRMQAGDVAVVPRAVPHWFVRSGPTPATALVVFAPPLVAPDTVPLDGVDSPASAR